jgi:N-acetylneuraminate synthase
VNNIDEIFIIAEIGQAHDGSLGLLHSYIDSVATTGVDAIKFQTHIAEAESSIYEPFRVNFSYEDKTRYDYWQRMEFSLEQWQGIKAHCTEVGLEFMSSPFSCAAVDLLEELGVKRYKIGSGEVSNFLLLEKIATTGKPMLLSSGMSSFIELDKTVAFMEEKHCDFSLFQCTTSYPTPAERVGLNVIQELKSRYGVPVGLSDHSGTIWPALAASSLGAEMIEVHVVFDKRMFGPDSTSSLTIDELKQLVEGVRFTETMLKNSIDKNNLEQYRELKKIFEKSLAVSKDLPAGHVLLAEDLESKKPANYGISCTEFETVVGRALKENMKRYDFLNLEDLE